MNHRSISDEMNTCRQRVGVSAHVWRNKDGSFAIHDLEDHLRVVWNPE